MRVLHTSDWHLGHRLYDHDRIEEHQRALDWLLETIMRQKVDVLVVAGDVFDVMNPSNAARSLYYSFLGKLRENGCRTAIIIGGNHDSPSLLDAPSDMMKFMHLHVIGSSRENIEDQIINIPPVKQEEPGLLVAAVPFLRDRDVKHAIIGESVAERISRFRAGIRDHYTKISAKSVEIRKHPNQPILTTGHLFAQGSEDVPEKTSRIYMADENNIEAGQFPDDFDYVALGHIHRAQRVGGKNHIRYAGSLIPLSFGEAKGKQSVSIVDINTAGQEVIVNTLTVPRFRRLIRVKGSFAEVKDLLEKWSYIDDEELRPWLEVRVVTDTPIPDLRQTLENILAKKAKEMQPFILRLSTERSRPFIESSLPLQSLNDLDPEEVFARLCTSEEGKKIEGYDELLHSFRELRSWMDEKDAAQ